MREIFFICLLITSRLFAQGVINNGANIVVSNNANIVIDGAAGHYTNQSGGLLSTPTANGMVKLQGNWVNNASNVAFSNDGITTELNGASQNIGGTNSTTFYNLTLSGTGTKTLNIATKAGGIVTTSGVVALNDRLLDLNQNELEITNTSTGAFTRTSGYVISETNAATNPSIIKWNTAGAGNYIFPFGASGDYIPLGLNITTAGASTISASTRATPTSNNKLWTTGVTNMASAVLGLPDASIVSVIDRWYEVQTSTAITADLTLSYRGTENTTTLAPTGTFALQRWNGTWEPQQGTGAGVTSGVGSVTASNVSEFSTFVLTNTSGPLPVALKSFQAYCGLRSINIEWETASESNLSYFVIERSVDAIQWDFVSQITAKGSTTSTAKYKVTDDLQHKTIYYRLKMIGLEGKEEISRIVSTSCRGSNNGLNVYPNPTTGVFSVSLRSEDNLGLATVEILDITGRMVHSQQVAIISGETLVQFVTDRATTRHLSVYNPGADLVSG